MIKRRENSFSVKGFFGIHFSKGKLIEKQLILDIMWNWDED